MPKKKPVARKTAAAKLSRRGAKGDYAGLLKAIESANSQLVGRAAAVVNQALVMRNWMIGAYIVEYEQRGSDRARYGERLLESLAKDLRKRGIRGLSQSILELTRRCYFLYPQIAAGIPLAVTTELRGTARAPDSVVTDYGIRQPAVGESEWSPIPQPLVTEFETPKGRKRTAASLTPQFDFLDNVEKVDAEPTHAVCNRNDPAILLDPSSGTRPYRRPLETRVLRKRMSERKLVGPTA